MLAGRASGQHVKPCRNNGTASCCTPLVAVLVARCTHDGSRMRARPVGSGGNSAVVHGRHVACGGAGAARPVGRTASAAVPNGVLELSPEQFPEQSPEPPWIPGASRMRPGANLDRPGAPRRCQDRFSAPILRVRDLVIIVFGLFFARRFPRRRDVRSSLQMHVLELICFSLSLCFTFVQL